MLDSCFACLEEPPRLGSVPDIFETILRVHSVLKDRYGLNPVGGERDDFESSQFCLLIANNRGIFGAYPDRSVTEFATFYAFGSGYRIALGAMHVAYNSGMSAEEVARAGVEAAAEFDEDSGLPAEVHRVELLTVDQTAERNGTTGRAKRSRKSRAGG